VHISLKHYMNILAGRVVKMSEPQVVELKPTKNHLLKLDDVNALVHQLVNQRLVILPTETGYLLGADALSIEAVKKVFQVKGRLFTNPIHVAVSNLAMAEDLVFLDGNARRLHCKLMPGPVTVICPKKPIVSDLLVANTGNLGIRIPDSPIVIQVVQAFGRPITATSLNVSAAPEDQRVEETISSLYWDDDQLVYLVRDSDLVTHTSPSTVVTFATTPWRILREGPIEESDIAEAVKSLSYTEASDWT
jgi:L-threonylcarbamoyladenylate synthase